MYVLYVTVSNFDSQREVVEMVKLSTLVFRPFAAEGLPGM